MRAELLAEPTAVSAGAPFWTAVRLTMDPGWHTYWKDPGDSGLPTKILWDLPAGFQVGEIQWPVPKKIEASSLMNYGYDGQVSLLVQLTPPPTLSTKNVVLAAKVTWLECADVCIPGKAEVRLSLPVSAKPMPPAPAMAAFFNEARSRLPPEGSDPAGDGATPLAPGLAVLFAFLGGLLLNLMPCVLPVLSIKVLGFLGTPRDTLRIHGLVYGAGVMVSFWSLALALIFLRAGGEKLGWGFQLQSPVFVALMGALFFTLGLNLLGVFEIGTSLIGLGGLLGGKSLRGAFFSGVLAVLVATPCTAPFMGSALGYAITQSAAVSLATFGALGFGMAFPYVILSFFPAGLRWIPKPGAWMLTLKQAMAFLFFGTTIWLLWVLGLQRGVGSVATTLLAFLGIAFGAWLAGPTAERSTTEGRKIILKRFGLAVSILSTAAVLALGGHRLKTNRAEAFSEGKVQSLLAAGHPVFVDFTAAWCLTCQINERTTLYSKAVQEAFQERNVTVLTADWTDRDPDITLALEKFGRNGVPLYVLHAPGRPPQILPALLTPDIVIDALKSLDKRSSS